MPIQVPGGFPGQAPNTGGNAGGFPEGPEFQEGIAHLMELGFCKTDSEEALRAAYSNVDRAAEYLFNGHIPENKELQQQQQQHMEMTLRLLAASLLINPRALENVVELLEQNDPSFRTNPERILQMFGNLPPERYDLEGVRNRTAQPLSQQEYMQLQAQAAVTLRSGIASQPAPGFQPGQQQTPGSAPEPAGPAAPARPQGAESLLAQFTPEEQKAIRRLQQLGNFDLMEVIQIYSACDKNEEMAANLLFDR